MDWQINMTTSLVCLNPLPPCFSQAQPTSEAGLKNLTKEVWENDGHSGEIWTWDHDPDWKPTKQAERYPVEEYLYDPDFRRAEPEQAIVGYDSYDTRYSDPFFASQAYLGSD